MLNVNWFTDTGRTYEIERSDDNGDTWISIITIHAISPFLDVNGTLSSLYRVRDDTDPTPSPWSPAFFGQRVYPVSVCTVTGYILNPNLTPKVGSSISIKYPIIARTGGNFISRSIHDGYDIQSDQDGFWTVDLPQDMWIEIKIEDIDLMRRILIPVVASATLESLL